MQLLPFQERVVQEKKELDEKIKNLHQFARTEIFMALKIEEKDRLNKQLGVMIEYSNILGERIDNFIVPSPQAQ